MDKSDRRNDGGRRKTTQRNVELKAQKPHLDLIDELRMQARLRAAANATMKVQPNDPKRCLEWKAADLIEQLLHLK